MATDKDKVYLVVFRDGCCMTSGSEVYTDFEEAKAMVMLQMNRDKFTIVTFEDYVREVMDRAYQFGFADGVGRGRQGE
jgi:hypothetical protein